MVRLVIDVCTSSTLHVLDANIYFFKYVAYAPPTAPGPSSCRLPNIGGATIKLRLRRINIAWSPSKSSMCLCVKSPFHKSLNPHVFSDEFFSCLMVKPCNMAFQPRSMLKMPVTGEKGQVSAFRLIPQISARPENQKEVKFGNRTAAQKKKIKQTSTKTLKITQHECLWDAVIFLNCT